MDTAARFGARSMEVEDMVTLTQPPSPLRIARITAALTQFQVAKKARLSPARVSLLERGHDEATPEERIALSRALGRNETELFPSGSTTEPGAGRPRADVQ